jgi:class 3 adenylate cyclase/DNA-binding transcriptional MerR regulator
MVPNVTALFPESEKPGTADGQWLSGNQVLEKTGIAKRDLIRFIQLGALPKSMMRLTNTGRGDHRKKSYFSSDILEHVRILKKLRDKGHSVEEIARQMRDVEKSSRRLEQSAAKVPSPERSPEEKRQPAFIPPRVHLPTETVNTAAFFVDKDLRIGWIKGGREDRLSRAIGSELANDPTGTVLDIILRASLQELVFNWPPLFAFIYRFLQETIAAQTFEKLAPTVSLNLEDATPAQGFIPAAGMRGPIASCPIRLEDEEGLARYLRLYGLALSEGALFILDEDLWRESAPAEKQVAVEGELNKTAGISSGKVPFSVLSARLDDSRRIGDTLLPETYFKLMTRIWDETDRVMATYGGQRAKRSGTEVQYVIPRNANTDPAYDAICCAVKLKDKVREIENALRGEGGWFSKIRLNIGISSGSDQPEQEDLTASMAFMLPGGAADQAFHLSAFAHGGAIWITKSAFSHLSPRQVENITFGIYRDDKLIPSIFTPLADLPHGLDTPPPGRAIQSLSVTRIIDLKSG